MMLLLISVLFIECNYAQANKICFSDGECGVFEFCDRIYCKVDLRKCPGSCLPGQVCPLGVCINNPLLPSEECRQGWVKFNNTADCYIAVTGSFTYPKATKSCTSIGGVLTSVHSDMEMEFIDKLANGGMIWLGIRKMGRFSNTRWDDGTVFDYRNFRGGQPDQCCDGARCIIANYNGKNGKWDDAGCGKRWKKVNVAVCKMKAGT